MSKLRKRLPEQIRTSFLTIRSRLNFPVVPRLFVGCPKSQRLRPLLSLRPFDKTPARSTSTDRDLSPQSTPSTSSLPLDDKYYAEDPDWVCIGSKTARSKFLLSQKELDKLPCFENPSPYGDETVVKTFWLKDVQNASIAIWGSLEAVRERIQRQRTMHDLLDPKHRIFGMSPEIRVRKPIPSIWSSVWRRITYMWRTEGHNSKKDKPPPWTPRPFVLDSDPAGRTVRTALLANLTQFSIKMGAYVTTGSATMFSEAMHSLADCVNQAFQFVGILSSARKADAAHPYGYGRERNIFAMFQGMSVLFIGAGASLWHGFSHLWMVSHHTAVPLHDPSIALGIICCSFFIETYTFAVALTQVRRQADRMGMSFLMYTRYGNDPINVSVMIEDGCGMVCSSMAALALYSYLITGNPVYDALGSIFIGSTLACGSYFMIQKNRDALIGRSLPSERLARICALLNRDPIVAADGVHDVKCTLLGGNAVRFKAEIIFNAEAIARRRSLRDGDSVSELFKKITELKSPQAAEDFLMREHALQMAAFSTEKQRIERQIRRQLGEFDQVHIDIET
eukprot:1014021_1